ncbi:hypothetical protein KKB69_02700 [Patescibacteria group bacterium]|nr:hypothetical protein [Patescibacteria group bacterium]
MKKNLYYNNDVCIVGIGCVLPEANNPREFRDNLLAGKCSTKKIPEERWKSRLYFSADKKEEDKTYSNVAAFVEDEQIDKLRKNLNLDSKNNRLQIMALEAARQSLACLGAKTLERARKKTSIFLGCMELDEALLMQNFFQHNKKSLERYIAGGNLKNKDKILAKLKEYFDKHEVGAEVKISSLLTTSVINLIKKKFNLQGESALIDAACASSLAALDVSVKSLKDYEADLVITGGIESNLGPDTFVLFSKVGALSEGSCHPFDKKADGLSQGEGVVVFVLQRLEDALRGKNKIYGLIKSIGSSSDGKSSSLFSPAAEGQTLAYERAYKNLDKNKVDYIECHGTGTKVGDATELESLNKFFGGRKIPMDSVKALVGHTKGAAGASGMLKCLLNMQNKKIKRCGISSFGFGNINYHAVLDEFDTSCPVIKKENPSTSLRTSKKIKDSIIVVGRSSVDLDKIDAALIASKCKIPPQSLPQIDKVQLGALLAAAEAFEKSNIEIDLLDKEKVSVISASCLGLDSAIGFVERIRHFEFCDALNFLDRDSLDFMIRHKNKFPEVTEDTGTGTLNNVIAGRVSNVFDFKGKNFNVDADFNSPAASLNIALRDLKEEGGLIVLLSCDERLNRKEIIIERKKISCRLLSTLSFAKEKNYPIKKIIKKVDYHE